SCATSSCATWPTGSRSPISTASTTCARSSSAAGSCGSAHDASYRELTRMRLAPDLVLVDGRFESGRAVTIADGDIVGVGPAPEPDDADVVRLPDKALLPGTVNTHCHTFQSLLRGLGDDLDFHAWRDRGLSPDS